MTSSETTAAPAPETDKSGKSSKIAPNWFVAAAWSVPALIAGDYLVGDVGWYALIPIAVMLVAVFREQSVKALNWWVSAMAVLFAIPFFYDVESGAGIIQDMHPVNLALFSLATLVVLVKLHRSHR